MALIDDIEFYGRAVAAGEMPRAEAARLLAEASDGGLTLLGAERAIDGWEGARSRLERQQADTVDALRALRNGKPVPDHVKRHLREDASGVIRRRPLTEPRRDWDETPAQAGRADADYWTDRDWDGEYDDPSDHYYC